jgi:hypothetical protein
MASSAVASFTISSASALSATIVKGRVTANGASERHDFGLYSSFVIPAGMGRLTIRAHTESQIVIAGCGQSQLLQFSE